MKKQLLRSCLAILSTSLLVACGGGGGSETPVKTENPPPVTVTVEQGIIIDSPIENLAYVTSSGEQGSTNANGEFNYVDGDTITFSLAGVEFPAVPAKKVMTPFDLFETKDTSLNSLVNFLRLVQSLDDDGDISSSITITDQYLEQLKSVNLTLNDFSLDKDTFESLLPITLVSREAAVNHFVDVLQNASNLDTDEDGIVNNQDNDNDNDGYLDTQDKFPFDANEVTDFDGDGIGDNTDNDDDNDDIPDSEDNFTQLTSIIGQGQTSDFTDVASIQNSSVLAMIQKDEKALYFVSTATGELLEKIEFALIPQTLFVDAESNLLYISLLPQDHSYSWSIDEQSSTIVKINTNTFEQVGKVDIAIAPYDFVVTENNRLVVSSGSGSDDYIRIYNADTGTFITEDVRYLSGKATFVINRARNLVFGLAYGRLYPIDLLTNEGAGTEHRYLGYDVNKLWFSADENYLYTNTGMRVSVSDIQQTAPMFDASLDIAALSYDQQANIFVLVTTDNEMIVINAESMLEINRFDSAGPVMSLSIGFDGLSYLTKIGNNFAFVKIPHPCQVCFINEAPTANFTYTPTNGDTTDTYVFDASLSTDKEDMSSLQYRWDFDNDGIWDTSFSEETEQEYSYFIAETKIVTLQVKDNGGLTAVKAKAFTVEQGTNEGVVIEDSVANQFDFAITDMAVDKANGIAYISSKSENRLYVVNLTSGETVKYIEFGYMPESVYLQPDTNKLYVALLAQEHSSYWWEEEQFGFIAIIDLEQQAHVDTLKIATDPYDIVVTSDNKLIVSSGSGQWTDIFALDATDGTELGRARIRQRSKLAMAPDETLVIAITTESSPGDIEKFDISGQGIVANGDSPYHGDHRMGGNVWITPDSKYALTRGGDLFNTSTLTFVQSITPQGISIKFVDFDEQQNLMFIVDSAGQVRYYNMSSFLELGIMTEIVSNAEQVIVFNEQVYTVDDTQMLTATAHPCLTCRDNTAPEADFNYASDENSTSSTYTFDASLSSDAEDAIEDMKFRWDLNGDGEWDTAFSSELTVSHKFFIAGTYPVTMQLIDTGGLVDQKTISVAVEQGTDFGVIVTDSNAYNFDFSITDIAIDRVNGYSYISDKSAKRLYVVNLATGETEKYFEFGYMPESVFLQPDTNKLYVALLAHEHSSTRWENEQSGYIAVFDTLQQAHINTFSSPVDPYDIVATSDNKLIVASGSGQWTQIHALDATDGSQLGNAGIRHRSKITLTPDEKWVIAANTDTSPSDIEKFDISGQGITSSGDSPYHGSHRMSGNVWATPDGKYVITRGGDLFNVSDLTFVRNVTPDGVSITSVEFDTEQNLLFIVDAQGQVRYYNLTSYIEMGTLATGAVDVERVIVYDGQVLTINDSKTMTILSHPCSTCGANTAPMADFTYSSDDETTNSTFLFDASSTLDNEDGLDDLEFRWDLESDGEWDSSFSSDPTISHKFFIAKSYAVTMQVKDSGGLTSTFTMQLSVEQGVDPGILVTDSEAFKLDFTVTDIAIDKVNGVSYITDKASKKLYVVNLSTGETEKYFEFQYMPESLYLQADTKKLYVALIAQEHSSYWWEEDQYGFIAVIDIEQKARVNTFKVDTDPYDIVATSKNKLVVASGSGQWTDIFAFNGETGVQLGKAMIRQRSRLTLSVDENTVIAADTDISPSDIEKFDISGTGITSAGDSPYHGGKRMGGNVWATPDGKYVLTSGGDMFNVSDLSFFQSLTEVGSGVKHVGFDHDNSALYTVESNNYLRKYSTDDYQATDSNNAYSDISFVFTYDNKVYIIYKLVGVNNLTTVTF